MRNQQSRWAASPPDLLLATANAIREARAIRPSISVQCAEADEKAKYDRGLPNNYGAVKGRNDRIRGGQYHFEIVEAGQDPNVPWRHTSFVLDGYIPNK